MTPAARSQYIAGLIALGNYLMAAAWPTTAQEWVQYLAGAIIAAITGWKAPSATASVARKFRATPPAAPSGPAQRPFRDLPHLPRGVEE